MEIDASTMNAVKAVRQLGRLFLHVKIIGMRFNITYEVWVNHFSDGFSSTMVISMISLSSILFVQNNTFMDNFFSFLNLDFIDFNGALDKKFKRLK